MALIDVFKLFLLPALIAATLYALLAYLLLPLYRSHRDRYRQYLPLHATHNLYERTSTFRSRVRNLFLPAHIRWRNELSDARYFGSVNGGGEGRRGSDGSSLMGEEEGERLVGFDVGRREPVVRAGEMDSQRMLSRDLEEGFKDESEDESGDGDERRR